MGFSTVGQNSSKSPSLWWCGEKHGGSWKFRFVGSFVGWTAEHKYMCLQNNGGAVVKKKKKSFQCKRCNRHGFNPWVGEIPWSRKWLPTPVFLPGKSHGQRSLAGYSPYARKEVRHSWATEHTHTHPAHSITPLQLCNQQLESMWQWACLWGLWGFVLPCLPTRAFLQDWAKAILLPLGTAGRPEEEKCNRHKQKNIF